jgi:hypothetical protein
MTITTTDRHPSTAHVAQFFASTHLPAHLRAVATPCEDLAARLIDYLPDDPELTVGLRKLLEAKDAFVRCAVAAAKGSEPTTTPDPAPQPDDSASQDAACPNCGRRVFRTVQGEWLHWPDWVGAKCPYECPGYVAAAPEPVLEPDDFAALVHGIHRQTQEHLCGTPDGIGTDALEPGIGITCPVCADLAAVPPADPARRVRCAFCGIPGLLQADDTVTNPGPDEAPALCAGTIDGAGGHGPWLPAEVGPWPTSDQEPTCERCAAEAAVREWENVPALAPGGWLQCTRAEYDDYLTRQARLDNAPPCQCAADPEPEPTSCTLADLIGNALTEPEPPSGPVLVLTLEGPATRESIESTLFALRRIRQGGVHA